MKVSFRATIHRGVICPIPTVAGRVAVKFANFKPDEILDVTVERLAKKRTLSQNAFYWDVVVPAFVELGYQQFSVVAETTGMAPKDSAHSVIKRMFLDPMVYTASDGTEYEFEPSTASLTTAQFSQMTDRAITYLNTLDIHLPARE